MWRVFVLGFSTLLKDLALFVAKKKCCTHSLALAHVTLTSKSCLSLNGAVTFSPNSERGISKTDTLEQAAETYPWQIFRTHSLALAHVTLTSKSYVSLNGAAERGISKTDTH